MRTYMCLFVKRWVMYGFSVFYESPVCRYSGYCAWKGALDFSQNENTKTIQGMRNLFYFICFLCWKYIWFMFMKAMTMKVNSDMIEKMYQEAEKVWVAKFVRVTKETKDRFLNATDDCDPLEQIFYDNVVLIRDVAHPPTPHNLINTNMSIVDIAVLGKCLEKQGVENLR